jgi:hypothetical protein
MTTTFTVQYRFNLGDDIALLFKNDILFGKVIERTFNQSLQVIRVGYLIQTDVGTITHITDTYTDVGEENKLYHLKVNGEGEIFSPATPLLSEAEGKQIFGVLNHARYAIPEEPKGMTTQEVIELLRVEGVNSTGIIAVDIPEDAVKGLKAIGLIDSDVDDEFEEYEDYDDLEYPEPEEDE